MYKLVRNSTVRMIVDTMKVPFPTVQYYEWDAHAEGFRLPKADLAGLVNFSCRESDRFHDITFSIAVMTLNDPGVSRLTDLVDLFYQRLQAHSRFDIYNPDGSLAGYQAHIFDGTDASPMGRVDARPTGEIQVSGRVGRAGLPLV